MDTRAIDRSIRGFAGTLWVIAALMLFAPSAARGGCDHPLLQPGLWNDEVATIGFTDFRSTDSPDLELPRPEHDPGPGPCRGALCSGQPASPIEPLTIVPPRLESSALWDRSDSRVVDPMTWIQVGDDPVAPSSESSGLFRPPRSGR
ncbi:MAG: hypothetical protein SFX72_00895 [Isosphaeraceae bacterium]|nr:hypothetical protein [Isosphaeraceae bacterium]